MPPFYSDSDLKANRQTIINFAEERRDGTLEQQKLSIIMFSTLSRKVRANLGRASGSNSADGCYDQCKIKKNTKLELPKSSTPLKITPSNRSQL